MRARPQTRSSVLSCGPAVPQPPPSLIIACYRTLQCTAHARRHPTAETEESASFKDTGDDGNDDDGARLE